MYEINEFCTEKKVPHKIQDAFIAYCKAHIQENYNIGSDKTATGLLMKFTQGELENCWKRFVVDLKDLLISQEKIA